MTIRTIGNDEVERVLSARIIRINEMINSVGRKRTILASEKAMWMADLVRERIAMRAVLQIIKQNHKGAEFTVGDVGPYS